MMKHLTNQSKKAKITCLSLFALLFGLTAHLAVGQTTTYSSSPSSGGWTTTPSSNISPSGCGLLQGNVIRDRVSISGSTATFEVAKVNGTTFSANGTVYIKDAACGAIVASKDFIKGANSSSVALNLSAFTSGNRMYVATLNSATGDKFYTNSITITANTVEPPAAISVSPTRLDFSSSGGTLSFDVSAVKSWVITNTNNPGGFTITPMASNKIEVKAASNATTYEQSGSIVVTATSSSSTKSQTVSFVQAGKVMVTPNLIVNPGSLSFPSTGGVLSVAVTSNVDWTYSTPTNKAFVLSRIVSNRLDITVSPNSTTSVQTGTVTITAGTGPNAKAQIISLSQEKPSFKVIGYLPDYQEWVADNTNKGKNKPYLSNLTHATLAFINPVVKNGVTSLVFENSNFKFATIRDNLRAITSSVSNKPLQVFVSLGGANGGKPGSAQLATYTDLLSDQKRASFVSTLTNFVTQNNFDGIDVDLEWDATRILGYNSFVKELSESVLKAGKVCTVTIEAKGGNVKYPSSSVLNNVSWVNMMAYDNPANDKEKFHAGWDTFVNSYTLCQTLVSSPKIVMGMPFYGYTTNTSSELSCRIFRV